MPASAPARTAYFLKELIKEADTSPFIQLEKKELFEKICFVLGYSSPTSAWGILFYLKGGKLIQEIHVKSEIHYKLEVKHAQKFIDTQRLFFEKTEDKKIKGDDKK